jgi:ribosomal protein S18 acetylase RimI-like enzyme
VVRSLDRDDLKEACFAQASLTLPFPWQAGGSVLRAALIEQLEAGELCFHAWRAAPEGPVWETVLLSKTVSPTHAVVMGALGQWQPPAIADLFEYLKRSHLALSAVPDQFPHPLEDLLALGFNQAERQTWRNHLLNTDFSGWENPDFRVLPWSSTWLEPAKELVVEAHQNTLSGLILTWPDVPTPSQLGAVVDRLCTPGCTLISEASFVALERDADALLGSSWLDLTPSGPLLHELCVAPPARRRGVARALVGAAQFALKQAGYTDMLYTTLGNNTGVSRLGVPHETQVVEAEAFAAWLSPRLAGAGDSPSG